jgi:hypothetical protein
MDGYPFISSLIGWASGITLLLGMVLMHLRLRNRASCFMVVFVILIAAWIPAKTWIYDWYSSRLVESASLDAAIHTLSSVDRLITELVALAFSVSFFLAVRSITGPNNSFKPKPLRGSA